MISIGKQAFAYCSYAESVIIGNHVKTIGEMAFTYCPRLESVTLGEGVETIDNSAFYSCSILNEIVIPNNVKIIGESAFESCGQLKSITLGECVETIGNYAFSGCNVMADIYIHTSTAIEIPENTFNNNCYKKATLHIPSGSLKSYAETRYWNSFAHIVDDIEPSGILQPTALDEHLTIFDMKGNRLPHFVPGINIVKYKNGRKKKYIFNLSK